MKRSLFSVCLLLAACFLPGCATEDHPMRAGIQQPIERHQESFWQSAAHFPRDLGRTIVHTADGRTTPTNDSL